MIKIIGAKGNIANIEDFLKNVTDFSQENNLTIQVFNADLIYGKNHLISAYEHAKRAFIKKTNTANSFEMEILLYASGERQLKLAIPKMGVKKGKANIAIFLESKKITTNQISELLNKLSLKKEDKVLEGNINKIEKFGINKNSIATVSKDKYCDLILEKVAMVDIIK